jgi:DNA repair exonuclease SbcCD ATPase subunit
MTRSERKDCMEEILASVKMAIEHMGNKKEDVERLVGKIQDLDSEFSEIGEVEGWDAEQLQAQLVGVVLKDAGLEEIQQSIEDFKSDLEDYKESDGMTEARRDALDEKYKELETVEDILSELSEDSDETEIDDVVESLEEAVDYLKDMVKY